MAGATPQEIEQLYQSLLGRAPDASGFDFWVQAGQAGWTPEQIAKQFISSPEYVGNIGQATMSNGVETLFTPIGAATKDLTGEGAPVGYTASDGRIVQEIKQEALTDWGSPTVTGYVAGDPTSVKASSLGLQLEGDPLVYRYETFDPQGNSLGYSYELAGSTSVFGNLRDVAAGILSSPIGIPLTLGATQWLTPALGAIGAGATVGAGRAAITGDNILQGAVVGGLAGGIKDYFGGIPTDTATNTPSIDSAIAKLEDAYKAADLPVDYAAIERSLLAQGFNPIGTRAVIDIARSTGTVADTATTSSQVVDIVGSKLADTSVLEALELVPAGTFTSGLATTTQVPTTFPDGIQTVEITGTRQPAPTASETVANVAPVVSTTAPTTVTDTPQTIEVTAKKDLQSEDLASTLPSISDVVDLGPSFPKETIEVTGDKVSKETDVTKAITDTIPSQTIEVTAPKEVTKTLSDDNKLDPTDLAPLLPETLDPGNVLDMVTDVTGEVPQKSWLTPENIKAIIALVNLLGLTKSTSTSSTTTNVGALPTQGVPTAGDDYYAQVQKYYNQYIPERPMDVATPLKSWYTGAYTTRPTATVPATTVPASSTTAPTGMMNPSNMTVQDLIDWYTKTGSMGEVDLLNLLNNP